MQQPVLTHAKRTAIGNFNGQLAPYSAVEIATSTLKEFIKAQNINFISQLDALIVGNVLSAGLGQNIARQISLNAGIPDSVPAYSINHVCGSGMQAIISAMNMIQAGNADIVIAGGVESMTNAPFVLPKHRWGQKMGHHELVDTLIQDGLWDNLHDIHMGITAENVAKKWGISREAQDGFAANSQQKASKAQQAGFFKEEIVPITVKNRKKETLVSEDEFIRHDTTPETLAGLRPVFDKQGTVTAGNASGINDGAAFVVIMSEKKAAELGCAPLAKLSGSAMVGYDPKLMGAAPCVAIPKVCEKAGVNISDIDVFELNEAFAAQSLAILKELKLDAEKVNKCGGAIALGHPIGASGARIVVTLIHQMLRENAQHGCASLCIGGGQATALILNR